MWMPALGGCFLKSKPATGKSSVPASQAAEAQPADESAPSGPEARIHISYSHPADYLTTLSVAKYSAADTVLTIPASKGTSGTASVIRFEGGVPAWQIDYEPGVFTTMPIGGSNKDFAISEVTYGKVPAHFAQSEPDGMPPEPLEPDHFYVFTVKRASGSISYEAVKVNGDGSLQAYAADPRAGSSFRLCCDLPVDFTITPPPAAEQEPPIAPDSP